MSVPTRKVAVLAAATMILVSFGALVPEDAVAAGACATTGTALGDSGDANNPTLIGTAQELGQLAADSQSAEDSGQSLTGYYKLTADIDLANCQWNPIGNTNDPFKGTLDGAGHTISGLSVSVTGYGGLFGALGGVGGPATVKDLGLIDVDVETTSSDKAGALAGEANEATLLRVYATGSVSSASDMAGGLAGFVQDPTVTDSYSRVTVVGSNEVGGLVGRGATGGGSTITTSYAANSMTVTGGIHVGGIASNANSFTPTVSNSFYDADLSGQSDTGRGTPKTTEEMKSFSTFSSTWDIVEGWEAFDFDSPDNVWGICEQVNDGYPFLLWQYSSDPCVEETAGSGSASGSLSSTPGIFLTVSPELNVPVQSKSIVFGAYAVKPGSAFLLSVGSLSSSAAPRVLSQGSVDSGGHLEREVVLPVLGEGSYVVVLTASSSDGNALKLSNAVSVDQNGNISMVTAERLQPFL